jgi:hypothetical protein
MENGKIDKIWDNSENGNPNFSIDLADGKRLYAREHVNANAGDMISYTAINTKTSKNGNHYTNVSGVQVVNGQQPQPAPQNTYQPEPVRTTIPNDSNRNIFVTGVVGRAMGSGNFQIQDIDSLTSMAIATYNKYFI